MKWTHRSYLTREKHSRVYIVVTLNVFQFVWVSIGKALAARARAYCMFGGVWRKHQGDFPFRKLLPRAY